MNNHTLRKAQLTQLEILRKFRDVCNVHGIRYILGDGTLLGAIRHNGFIPWDDDIDVNMPREDYERFLNYANELGEDFYLQTWKSDKEFALPFAKVRMKGTVYQEESSPGLRNNGIYIDIFPCDRFGNLNAYNKFRFKVLNFLRLVMLKRSKAYKMRLPKKNWLRDICVFIAKLIPRSCLIGLYELLAKNENKLTSNYKYFENGGASSIGTWIIDAECLEKTALHRFEDDEFAVPENYDLYLSTAYDDYMKLPPEEKRENRHGILRMVFREENE